MIKINIWKIKTAAYFVLTLPIVLFLFGWVKLILAIPASLALIAAFVYIVLQLKKDDDVLELSKASLITIGVLLFLWCFISGHGGFFYQSNDHHWRNAIFRDLINFDWPVVYEQSNNALVYYIGFWLVPALVGKITALISPAAAWDIANIAMFVWSFIFLYLTTLLVCTFAKVTTFRRVLLTLLIIIFFSGMDIVGVLLNNKWSVRAITDHIEWWGKHYQYSSNSTQLFWVFNQSTPAWLATALFLNEKSIKNYVFLCLVLLPCSPFPMIGLFVLLLGSGFKFLYSAIKEKQLPEFLKDAFSVQNIVAAVVILPVFYLYYKGNMAIDTGGFRFWLGFDRYERSQAIYYCLCFLLLEFGILAIVLFKRCKKSLLYWLAVISLCFIDMFRMGAFADFSMRASIPALFVLMALTISKLQSEIGVQKTPSGLRYYFNKFSITIMLVLVIGAVTPLIECFRAINAVIVKGRFDVVADNIITFSDKPVKDFTNFMTVDYENSDFWRYLRD